MCQTSRRTSHSSTQQQPKVVQDVHAQDQNTGKTKNVNIVEMIRSMGLHELQAKNSANVQEMAIVHEHEHNFMDRNPVFYTPVDIQIVMTIWENCHEIMEPEVCTATPPIVPVEHCVFDTKQINMITVHDMEPEKCSLLQCVY